MTAGKVFISYSHNDRTVARALTEALSAREFQVWNSEESVEPGEGIATALRSMINDSDVVVLLVSRDSINSRELLFEAGAALGQDKRVVVVTLSRSVSRDLPFGLDEVARISAEGKKPSVVADRISALLFEEGQRVSTSKRRSLNELHVTPRSEGGWAVIKQGAKRASSLHDKKSDAMKVAREAARRGKSELVIHNRDGRIVQKDSHGHDPRRSKG